MARCGLVPVRVGLRRMMRPELRDPEAQRDWLGFES